MTPHAEAFERCIAAGGVVVFGADTVYGLACDPESPDAVARLYALKGRAAEKPSALMFFDAERALAAHPDLGPRTREALRRLLPGPVTVVLASGGLRVPRVERDHPLHDLPRPVLQSSANRAGAPEARQLEDVDRAILAGADLVLDAGELPGTASTVVDLRRYERRGEWKVIRLGALGLGTLEGELRSSG